MRLETSSSRTQIMNSSILNKSYAQHSARMAPGFDQTVRFAEGTKPELIKNTYLCTSGVVPERDAGMSDSHWLAVKAALDAEAHDGLFISDELVFDHFEEFQDAVVKNMPSIRLIKAAGSERFSTKFLQHETSQAHALSAYHKDGRVHFVGDFIFDSREKVDDFGESDSRESTSLEHSFEENRLEDSELGNPRGRTPTAEWRKRRRSVTPFARAADRYFRKMTEYTVTFHHERPAWFSDVPKLYPMAARPSAKLSLRAYREWRKRRDHAVRFFSAENHRREFLRQSWLTPEQWEAEKIKAMDFFSPWIYINNFF